MTLEVIVLAAGKGTRMRSALPKVLHRLAGRPLLDHVLRTAALLQPARIHVVCGYGAQAVREQLGESGNINWVEQVEQLGTGHAVSQALPHISPGATILVLYGDVPLVRENTLNTLVTALGPGGLALLTAELSDPTGYGRIVRDERDKVIAVVEEREASEVERAILEINTGFMAGFAEQFSA